MLWKFRGTAGGRPLFSTFRLKRRQSLVEFGMEPFRRETMT